jgi:uncharacterized membrane protein
MASEKKRAAAVRSGVQQIIREGFDIPITLYIATLLTFAVYTGISITGTGDLYRLGTAIAGTLVVLISMLLVFHGTFSYNNGAGISLYGVMAMMIASLFSYTNSGEFITQFYLASFISVVIIGISSFLVEKLLSIATSTVIGAVLTVMAYQYGDAYLKGRIIYVLAVLIGVNFVSYVYRVQLERRAGELHEKRAANIAQRNAMMLKRQNRLIEENTSHGS